MRLLRAAAAVLVAGAGMAWSTAAVSQVSGTLSERVISSKGHSFSPGGRHHRWGGHHDWDRHDRCRRHHCRDRDRHDRWDHDRHGRWDRGGDRRWSGRFSSFGLGYLPWIPYDPVSYRSFGYRDSDFFWGGGFATRRGDYAYYDYDRGYPYDHYRNGDEGYGGDMAAAAPRCRVEWPRDARNNQVPVRICTR
jgi:hypothetical protein